MDSAIYLDAILSGIDDIVDGIDLSASKQVIYESVRRSLARLIIDDGCTHSSTVSADEEFRDLDELMRGVGARLEPTAVTAAVESPVSASAIQFALRLAGLPEIVVHNATTLIGGRSKQTILVEIEGVAHLPAELILRRDVAATSLGTTVRNEFPLLKALAEAGAQVPEPILLVEEPGLDGYPFILLERVAGRTVGSILPESVPTAQLQSAAAALARVHAVPVERFQGIVDDRPSMADEIDRLRTEYNQSTGLQSATVRSAMHWLSRNIPEPPNSPVLVHADFSFHNLMFEGDDVTAILDWELAHLGSAAEDMCYLRSIVTSPEQWKEVVVAYQDADGLLPVDAEVAWYRLRALVRLHVQLLRARVHFESGLTNSNPLKAEGALYWLPRTLHSIAHALRDAEDRADPRQR